MIHSKHPHIQSLLRHQDGQTNMRLSRIELLVIRYQFELLRFHHRHHQHSGNHWPRLQILHHKLR